jgi:hypothetical protein
MAGTKGQVRLAKLVAPSLPKGESPRAVVGVQSAIPIWGYALLVVGALLAGVGFVAAYAIVTMTRKRFVLVLTSTGVFVVRLTKRPCGPPSVS